MARLEQGVRRVGIRSPSNDSWSCRHTGHLPSLHTTFKHTNPYYSLRQLRNKKKNLALNDVIPSEQVSFDLNTIERLPETIINTPVSYQYWTEAHEKFSVKGKQVEVFVEPALLSNSNQENLYGKISRVEYSGHWTEDKSIHSYYSLHLLTNFLAEC